jgi:hypothetical protein
MLLLRGTFSGTNRTEKAPTGHYVFDSNRRFARSIAFSI